MTEIKTMLTRLRHISDQAWGELRSIEADLTRIAYNGPEDTEHDKRVCRIACMGILASLGERAIDTVLPELGIDA